MARPLKLGVDYFPLDVKMDDEIELIESEHKITGFAVLVKLWQRVYASNYWLKWDKKEVIVFSNRINVDKNEVIAIINTCFEWDILSKNLFNEYSIITSHGIQKRFFEIVKRRTQLDVVEEFLLMDVPIREKQTIVIVDINSVNVSKSTQSKVKERKGKEPSKDIYLELFLKLCTDYPGKIGSKSQTFKNYKTTKKQFLWNDEQTCQAVMGLVEKQRDENKGGDIYFYQLSNVLGQKYRDDLPECLARFETNKKKAEERQRKSDKEVEDYNSNPDNF